jgi:competence protein ComEC
VEAVVTSEPVVKEKSVVVDLLTLQGRHKLKARFRRDSRSERLALGDGLTVLSNIYKVHAWKNGHFDYQRYMVCHGYVGEVYVRPTDWQWQQLSLSSLSWVQRMRLRFLLWRHGLLSHFRQWGIDDQAYGIIAAMTLGEKSQLDASQKEIFSRVGASHVLALSGLHLMIIYTVISLFVGWRRFRTLSQILIVLAIWAFAFLVGLSSSVVRAALMISIYALLSLGYRERMSVNTLAFVAIIMLLFSPLALYDVGFQLSFTAVLAIVLLNPLLSGLIAADVQQRHGWLKAWWGLTSVSISAQVGTAPLVAYYFGRLPVWFLLSNYVVIPLATLTLYLALCCIACFWWSALQGLLATALSAVVVLMNRLLEIIAALPAASIEGIRLTAFGVLMLYIIIGSCYVLLRLWIRKR